MIDKEEILMGRLLLLLSNPFSSLTRNPEIKNYFLISDGVDELKIVDDGDGNRYIHVENYPIYIPFDTGCESLYERKLRVGVP